MASAGARADNGGLRAESSSGVPGGIALGRGSGNDFGTKAHISCAVLMLVVVVDLTETTRQRHTFNTAAILSVND